MIYCNYLKFYCRKIQLPDSVTGVLTGPAVIDSLVVPIALWVVMISIAVVLVGSLIIVGVVWRALVSLIKDLVVVEIILVVGFTTGFVVPTFDVVGKSPEI